MVHKCTYHAVNKLRTEKVPPMMRTKISAALVALDAKDVEGARRILVEALSASDSGLVGFQAYGDKSGPASAGEQLPFKQGDWVMRIGRARPMIGIVQDCYLVCGELSIDLVVYREDGKRIGRVSPACGGPRRMEPSLPALEFKKIRKPSFPLVEEAMLPRCVDYAHLLVPFEVAA